MSQAGFFDFDERLDQLNRDGNPLQKLADAVDLEAFRPTLETLRDKPRKSNAGAKPFDAVMMFKILILRSLYNLSVEQTEFQIRDRVSLMAFLGLTPGDRVPDDKTIWHFENQLTQAGLTGPVFEQFERTLSRKGFAAKGGSMIDASIVSVPKQRNTKEENDQIKGGERPDSFDENPSKGRQKDTDARWTKKRGKSHFGDKNHVNVDAGFKLIRQCEVTPAWAHDSQVLDKLLDPKNKNKDVYADSAYSSAAIEKTLAEAGYRSRIHRKAHRNRPLSDATKRANKKKSKTRVRVEHTFGQQSQNLGGTLLRTIGLVRAKAQITLRNLVYNMQRYVYLRQAYA